MEVKKAFRQTLLLAAIFGAAGLAAAEDNLGFISTDSSAAAPAVQAVDGDVPQTAPTIEESAAEKVKKAITPASKGNSAWDVIEFNGFINGGGIFNTHGARYNMMSLNSDNQFELNTAYLRAFKTAQTGSGVVDWGFGADALFGSEARLYHGYIGLDDDWNTGHRSSNYNDSPLVGELSDAQREDYGAALPQLYGELTFNNWRFKAGHFYSLFGYEGPADSRFFYTYGRFIEASPLTNTGALATFTGIGNMELSVGWVMGENNTFSRGYDESLITGGMKVHAGDVATLKYAFVAGDGAMGGTGGDLFRNDVVLSAKLGCWESAFLFNYGKFDGESASGTWGATASIADLAQLYGNLEYQTWGSYLYYTLNPKWKIGTRMEWQRGTAEDKTAAMECFEMTLGANWTPTGSDNFAVRPEVRYDKAILPQDEVGGMFGKGLSDEDQVTLAFDMLFKF